MNIRRLLLPIVILLASSMAATAADGAPDLAKASRFQIKGDRALQTGNIAAAEKNYQKALEAVSDLPPAHIGLGQIAMSRSEFHDALDHFEAARDGYEDLGLALGELEMKRYANARSEIQSARDNIQSLQANTNDPQAVLLQVSQLQSRIDQLEAISAPTDANLQEAPGEIYFYIGNALFRLNRFEEAVVAWENCRDKSPKFALVYNNLALAYGRQGKIEKALESLDKAVELGFPVNPQLRTDLEALAAESGS